MADRLAAVGGEVSIHSTPGAGTTVAGAVSSASTRDATLIESNKVSST
jgi:hypothetical protein